MTAGRVRDEWSSWLMETRFAGDPARIKRPELTRWEHLFQSSGNPKIPTLEQAVAEALTPAEAEQLVDSLRPLVERGEGMRRDARAYLWARK